MFEIFEIESYNREKQKKPFLTFFSSVVARHEVAPGRTVKIDKIHVGAA